MGTIKKLILYGAGKFCERLCDTIKNYDIEILCIVDSSSQKQGKEMAGHTIEPPESINKYFGEYILISITNFEIAEEVRKMLINKYYVPEEAILEYFNFQKYLHKCDYLSVTEIDNTALGKRENDFKTVIFDCCNGLVLGGIESWTIDLCRSLMKNKWEHIRIMTDDADYPVASDIADIVDKVPIDKKCIYNETDFDKVFQYLLSKIPCVVITSQPDILLFASSILKRKLSEKITVIPVIHNGTQKYYQNHAVYEEEADLFIGVSADIKNGMCRNGVDPQKVLSMTCPFECGKELSRTYTEDKTLPIKIGYAGRLEIIQKRMDLLLQLIEILDRDKVNFQFEIAGEGREKEAMEEFIRVRGLDKRVVFLGRIDRSEIKNFWKRQDICVNVADFEGRCISKLEAMANGAVPIIAEVAGAYEDIMQNENGFVVPPQDIQALADKIKYLEQHRERLCVMGRLAHDSVYPKSQMETHIKFWEEILENYGCSRQGN